MRRYTSSAYIVIVSTQWRIGRWMHIGIRWMGIKIRRCVWGVRWWVEMWSWMKIGQIIMWQMWWKMGMHVHVVVAMLFEWSFSVGRSCAA